MEQRPQALIEELRRAITRTPDPADQKALYEKLGLLEVELEELARRQRALRAADTELARTRHALLGWRAAVAVLATILAGLILWLAGSLLRSL